MIETYEQYQKRKQEKETREGSQSTLGVYGFRARVPRTRKSLKLRRDEYLSENGSVHRK